MFRKFYKFASCFHVFYHRSHVKRFQAPTPVGVLNLFLLPLSFIISYWPSHTSVHIFVPQETPYIAPQYMGSAACFAVIKGSQITIANVGDSRCIVSKNGKVYDLLLAKCLDEPN